MKASVLELQIKELPLFKRGKVREVYDLGENLLLFSTDRISAFDHVLPVGIPNKGCILNSISSYWFKKTKHIVPNHFITDQVKDYPKVLTPYLEILDGRSMIVKKAQLIEIECVVRGYLAGSAWKEYREKRTIAGEKQPAGLGESAKLIKPLFTPAIKASFGHDENISVLEMMRIVGEDIGLDLAKYSLALYQFASESALLQGLILADTKFASASRTAFCASCETRVVKLNRAHETKRGGVSMS